MASENWVFLLVVVAMVAMHLFGHGSHGGHGGHRHRERADGGDDQPVPPAGMTPAGFLVGPVKSFLYGGLVGLVYVPIYNMLARRFE